MDARNPYRYAPNGLTVVKVATAEARDIVILVIIIILASFHIDMIDNIDYA